MNRSVVLCVIGIVGLLTSVGLCGDKAEQAERPLVFGVNRIADQWVLYSPPSYVDDVYSRVVEAGGTVVRLTAAPRDIEKVRGTRDWTEFDKDLNMTLKHGLEPMILICNTPAWASPTGEDTHLYAYKPELFGEFSDFCRELAERTKGKVKYFQLWNEQNGCSWHFHDGWNHADEYVPFLEACWKGLKKGNPDCLLSLGALDDAQGNAPIFMRRTYLEKKKQNIEGEFFDFISDHPYSDTPDIMRGKLDKLNEIMEANGDKGKKIWITEWGYHMGHMSLEEQASRTAAILEAFISPDWSEVEAAVYLSIGDFEGRFTGFGLCDANLRRRPAFYAFQGASRFGAFPAYKITPTFTKADELVVTWQTKEETIGKLVWTDDQKKKTDYKSDKPSKTHRVVIKKFDLDKVYGYQIETVATETKKSHKSIAYTLRTPGKQVYNGGFEQGFFGGIGNGWELDGKALCTDAVLVPRGKAPEGKHAQAVFARGERSHKSFDGTMSTIAVAEPGKVIRFAMDCAGRTGSDENTIVARFGIDPKGGAAVTDPDIAWSDWTEMKPWDDEFKVEAVAKNSIVRLYIQSKSTGDFGKSVAAFIFDNVRVVAE